MLSTFTATVLTPSKAVPEDEEAPAVLRANSMEPVGELSTLAALSANRFTEKRKRREAPDWGDTVMVAPHAIWRLAPRSAAAVVVPSSLQSSLLLRGSTTLSAKSADTVKDRVPSKLGWEVMAYAEELRLSATVSCATGNIAEAVVAKASTRSAVVSSGAASAELCTPPRSAVRGEAAQSSAISISSSQTPSSTLRVPLAAQCGEGAVKAA